MPDFGVEKDRNVPVCGGNAGEPDEAAQTVDWTGAVERLVRYLRIKQTPVGVKYFETKEEICKIPKVRIPTRHIAPCTTISQAVQFNWTAACLAETVHINYCRGIHGMFERDEKWRSGKIFDKVYYENMCDSKAHHEALSCLPPKYAGFVASPLVSGRLHDVDACIVYADSAQAFMLLAGWQYFGYEKLEFTFVGESTCSDSWVSTILTGKPKVSIPSFADRKFGGMKDDELVISMKEKDLLRAIDGVEALFKSGLRYPIAPYSLTTDMIDGLPKSYLEF